MMRLIAILLILCGVAGAAVSDLNEELLEAKIELAAYRLKYGEMHPKRIELQAHIQALSKEAPALTPSEYLSLIKRRLVELQAEEAAARLRYGDQHPKMIEMEAKVKFLREEEKNTSGRS